MTDSKKKTLTGKQGDAVAGPSDVRASFLSMLPEDIRDHEALASYEDAGRLAQDYLDLHGRYEPPPDSADDYEIGEIDGMPFDKSIVDAFRQAAHQAGLSQKQTKALVGWHNDLARRQFETVSRLRRQHRDESEEELREEWGRRYDRNLAVANRALRALGEPDLVESLVRSGWGDDPGMVRLFYRIGRSMSEDAYVDGRGPGSDVRRTPGGLPLLYFPSMDPNHKQK